MTTTKYRPKKKEIQIATKHEVFLSDQIEIGNRSQHVETDESTELHIADINSDQIGTLRDSQVDEIAFEESDFLKDSSDEESEEEENSAMKYPDYSPKRDDRTDTNCNRNVDDTATPQEIEVDVDNLDSNNTDNVDMELSTRL